MQRAPAREPSAAGKPALMAGALLCLFFGVHAAAPVLNGLQLHGGSRGVMLALLADGPFDVTTALQKGRNGASVSTVVVMAKGLIYGLESAAFEALPKESPVKAISVKENTRARTVEISLKMAVQLSEPPKARAKETGWLILLSEAPVQPFAWDATQAIRATGAAAPTVTQKPAPKQAASPQHDRIEASPSSAAAAPSPASPSAQQLSEKTRASAATLIRLSGIKRVRRGTIENVVFIFDSNVHWVAKRQQQQAALAFENAASALDSAQYSLADSPVFTSLKLTTAQRGAVPWLIATMDFQPGAERPFVVISSSPTTVTVSTEIGDAAQRLALWSADRGLRMTHDFAAAARSQPDYGPMRLRAYDDSKRMISAQETFTLKEPAAPAAPLQTPPQPAAKPAADQPAAGAEAPPLPAQAPPPPQPAAELPAIRLVVVKDKVNLRSRPSSDEESRVIARLSIGAEAVQIAAKGEWRKVETPQATGWIHQSLVQEFDKTPQSFWAGLRSEKTTNEEKSTAPMVSALEQKAALPRIEETSPLPETAMVVEPAPRDTAFSERPSTIVYHVYGRDPFLPLEFGQHDSMGLPSVDRMRLVGILYDEFDRVALFEDTQLPGKAHALREADAVKNGKVLQIQENSVVFLVTEFDISRTVTLRLAKPAAPVAESRLAAEAAPAGAEETKDGGASTAIPEWAQPKAMLQRQQEAASPIPPLPQIQPENAKIRRRGGWAKE